MFVVRDSNLTSMMLMMQDFLDVSLQMVSEVSNEHSTYTF